MHRLQSSWQQNSPSTSFNPMRDILDGKHRVGSFVSVIGIITDFRAPIATRGSDWKCQIRLYDQSVEDDSDDALLFNVFRSQAEMPEARCGDIAIVFMAKVGGTLKSTKEVLAFMLTKRHQVQKFHSDSYSLCTHWSTDVHIYLAGQIPDPPRGASTALRPPTRKTSRQPSKEENAAVSALYRSIDKSRVPTETEFEVMKVASLNVKDKFQVLEQVQDGKFADSVVQIVKDPYDLGNKITLWVSDYSENPLFFNFEFKGGRSAGCQDGDPLGNLTNFSSGPAQSEWKGPFGKRSIQITCFEPHASMIRDRGLASGSWISVRNLQIGYGHNGANLEGFLREERGAQGIKINILPLDTTEDSGTINPRLKEAVRRKRNYECLKESQLKSIEKAAKAGAKRKSNAAHGAKRSKPNSRARRGAERERARAAEVAEKDQVATLTLDNLNRQVKCENKTKPASSVADILEQIHQETSVNGQSTKVQLPFINAKYRTQVRVVNFMPPKLEDFAVAKRSSEYDMLSDNDDSDSGSDLEQEYMTESTAEQQWEWRFYLELQDAAVSDGQKKESVWVLVDNPAAQLLMDLNASDLRRDSQNLENLRQRMFILWGKLEEHKTQRANQAFAHQTSGPDGPPADSSDDEDQGGEKKPAQVENCPFSCCIHQYGIKVSEAREKNANAGGGKRWQRVYGLFGTKISLF